VAQKKQKNFKYHKMIQIKTKNDTINLIDSTFSHSKIGYCSDYQDSLFFKWKRENFNKNGNDFVVYTDARLGEVTNNHNSIAWLIEPKEIAPYTYDFIVNNNNKFKKVFTHEKSLLDKGGNYELLPFGCCWIKPEDQKIYNKSKMISIISSNKTQTNGHRLRHEIVNQLNGKIPYILDGGPCIKGLESTIIGMENNAMIIYRLGSISIEQIEHIIGYKPLVRLSTEEAPLTSGMVKHHYAPITPLFFMDSINDIDKSDNSGFINKPRFYLPPFRASREAIHHL
jgi:hypothetical protein